MTIGYIHSIENGGMRDGPGIRFVIFFAGCPLRCQFCHNPDTWQLKDGTPMEASEILQQISSAATFLQAAHGGVTISGGEPLMQPDFLLEILQGCQQLGIHTTLDISGFCYPQLSDAILACTDLVLLDIKSFDPATYKLVTGVELAPTLQTLAKLQQWQISTWIRIVVVPNLNDNLDAYRGLANLLSPMSNIECVELLPFHKLGEFKWQELDYDYQLYDTLPPDENTLHTIAQIFTQAGLIVRQ